MKTIVKATQILCKVTMVLAFLAAVDAVQAADTMAHLLVGMVTPTTMFICAYVGNKVINETSESL